MTPIDSIKKLNMLDEALNFQRADADESSCALQMAIQALEKQIPKKPIDNGLYSGIFATHKYYSCPKCGNACLKEMMNERQNTDYCWNCGQAILWEGVNENDGE